MRGSLGMSGSAAMVTFGLIFLVIFLVAVVIGLLVRSKQRQGGPDSPRRKQQRLRRLLPWLAGLDAILAVVIIAILLPDQPWLVFFFLSSWLFGLAWMTYTAFKRITDKEAALNYGVDPEHCGRCGYDLTGNLSGICPECGWELTAILPEDADPHWQHWWKQWRIEYLPDWPWHLGFQLFGLAIVLAVACFAFRQANLSLFLIICLLALPMLINIIRISGYVWRRLLRKTSAERDEYV